MDREQFIAALADLGCYNRLMREADNLADAAQDEAIAAAHRRVAKEWRDDRNNTSAKLIAWFDSLEQKE